jgi:thiosulfate dehydrogenase [quinone] large subunit
VAAGLVINAIRLLMGWMWLQQVQWKMPPDWGCTPNRDRGLCDWIQREIDYPLIPLYRDILVGFVQPNLDWFGGVVWAVELVIAVALLLGLFTKIGALLATGMGINLLIGLWNVPHEWYWTYVFLIFVSIFLFLANAGRPLGLDHVIQPRLASRLPRALRWLV